jgi:hypothetical protein
VATPQDIRNWATEHGREVNPRGPVPKDIQDAFYDQNDDQSRPEPAPEIAPAGDDGASDEQRTTPGEKPPGGRTAPKTWGLRKPGSGGKRTGPRAPTEGLFAGIWTVAANLLGATGMTPTARVLQLQAPVAGAILDRELRGTAVDRAAQPLARMMNKGSAVGSLVALPLMVQVVTMKPELYPMARPLMIEALYRWMEVAGPEMEKKTKRAAKRREQLGDMDPEAMLDMIFAADAPEAATAE